MSETQEERRMEGRGSILGSIIIDSTMYHDDVFDGDRDGIDDEKLEPPKPPISTNVNTVEIGGEGKGGDGEASSLGPAGGEEKKGKEWRLQAKHIFLTYAKCELGCHVILDELKDRLGILSWVMCDEQHKDGSGHSHLLIKLDKKPDIKDVRFFDIDGFHPNIQVNKGQKKNFTRWLDDKTDYVMKDGKYYASHEVRILGRTNYKRKRMDLEAWQDDCDSRRLDSPFPFTIDGVTITSRDNLPKKCCWMIHGPPSTGKTTMLQRIFHNKKVYWCVDGEHPFDNYCGEEIMIFNDMEINKLKTKIFMLSEDAQYRRWLSARYNNKPLPKGRIIVIITTNRLPDWWNEDGVKERFNYIFMDQRRDALT